MNGTYYRLIQEQAEADIKGLEDELRLRISLPVPIVLLAQRGKELRCQATNPGDLGRRSKGALDVENRRILYDGKSPLTSPATRFTIAHEIGHWVLHYGDDSSTRINDGCLLSKVLPSRRKGITSEKRERLEEVEANHYAAAVLIPYSVLENKLRRFSRIGKKEVELLAEDFGVSSKTMLYRIKNLYSYENWTDPPVDWISLNGLEKTVERATGVSLQQGFPRRRPQWTKRAKLILEFAGLPNAGKDTQIDTLRLYLWNQHKLRVATIQEGFAVSPIPYEPHSEQLAYVVKRTLAQLIEYGVDSTHDVIILNRGPFDFFALYHWWYLEGKLTREAKQTHLKSLLLENWQEWIDCVFLLNVSAEESMRREKESRREAAEMLAKKYDGVCGLGSQRIVNQSTLSRLSQSYNYTLETYRSEFSRVVVVDEDKKNCVSDAILKAIHSKLPVQNRRLFSISSNGNTKKMLSQLRLPGL